MKPSYTRKTEESAIEDYFNHEGRGELSTRSVNLEEKQWQALNEIQEKLGAPSRNELLRKAVKYYLEEKGWKQ